MRDVSQPLDSTPDSGTPNPLAAYLTNTTDPTDITTATSLDFGYVHVGQSETIDITANNALSTNYVSGTFWFADMNTSWFNAAETVPASSPGWDGIALNPLGSPDSTQTLAVTLDSATPTTLPDQALQVYVDGV